jgi:DNA modification methylase
MPHHKFYLGDSLEILRQIEPGTVQTCVTSPPYWGLRDYGVDEQLGLEKTPEEYVQNMVEVFREVRQRPKGWDTPSRPRVMAERYPTEQKTIWEITEERRNEDAARDT